MQGIHFLSKQFSGHFRICNKGFDSINRFLTVKDNELISQQVSLDELNNEIQGMNNTQIWFIERSNQNNDPLSYTIRYNQTNFFLTLIKDNHLNQYFIGISTLYSQQDIQCQLWIFQTRENHHVTIKVQPQKGQFYYLQSLQAKSSNQHHQNLLVMSHDEQAKYRYLRNWKLIRPSSMVNQFGLPANNIQNILKFGKQNCQDLLKSFKGQIYTKDDSKYFLGIQQYASLNVPKGQMQPYYLAYPLDVKDITTMIKVAELMEKKIVARSGGHQYSGLSVGNCNTITLSMDHFDTFKLHQDGLIEVGSFVSLIEFSERLSSWGIFIPRGQCPLVNIGGIGQTGGYGPLVNSFGLLIDYIQSFEIVLSNGELKKVHRPKVNDIISNQQQKLNQQLFRNILGGNAGSFGVVVKYFLRGIKEANHPYSYGFAKIRRYRQDLFRSLLILQKSWTQMIANGEYDKKLRGNFFQFGTCYVQEKSLNIQQYVIIVQGSYGDPIGGVPYDNQLQQILELLSQGQTQLEKQLNVALKSWEGYCSLNEISHKNIYQFPQLTQSVREVSLPYNRRCNLTLTPLTDSFIDGIVNLTTKMINQKDGSLSFNSLFVSIGGAYKDNANLTVDGMTVTALPLRSAVHTFMFDLQYDLNANPDADKKAINIQQKLKIIVDKHYSTPGLGEKKFFWASFGDLDIRKEQVINNYYDSLEQYSEAQKLKSKVDPKDIFHTILTVKPQS